MKSISLWLVICWVSCAIAAEGQTFKYADGRTLQVEVVQEPPCPLGIKVKQVNLSGDPETHLISLEIENQGPIPIRAYAMVSGGNRHPNMHTWIFGGAAFEPGQTIVRGVWPNSQDHYYFFFDYILFADGSVCGLDNHRRSMQIRSYLESRAVVTARLRELSADIKNADEVMTVIDKMGGYFSADNPGPPNPETIKTMPRRAWEHVILQLWENVVLPLRNDKARQKKLADLVGRLSEDLPN